MGFHRNPRPRVESVWPRPSVLKGETEATGATSSLMPSSLAGQYENEEPPPEVRLFDGGQRTGPQRGFPHARPPWLKPANEALFRAEPAEQSCTKSEHVAMPAAPMSSTGLAARKRRSDFVSVNLDEGLAAIP
jgi:hypothetical protein